jgi:hypothetical protein
MASVQYLNEDLEALEARKYIVVKEEEQEIIEEDIERD